MEKDSLGDRMKGYEIAARSVLPSRMPVIVRVDGKAFHTYTKGCKKPFDTNLQGVMNDTAIALCERIQGAQFAYVQSDEISILVHGYKKFRSMTWFDNQVQKMASVSAAIASATFTSLSWKIWEPDAYEGEPRVLDIRPATFDSRVFVVPEADVCNYFLWRQQDTIRNSVQSVARSVFSHKECEGKTCAQLQEMLARAGQNWLSFPDTDRLGRIILKREYDIVPEGETEAVVRSHWITDYEMTPVFGVQRDFVNNFLKVEEE